MNLILKNININIKSGFVIDPLFLLDYIIIIKTKYLYKKLF